MTGDAMKLVKFMCTAPTHANGRSDASLTIHDGVWAFCPAGADAAGHRWQPSDGLPIADALRFTPRQPAPPSTPEPTAPAAQSAPITAKGKARSH